MTADAEPGEHGADADGGITLTSNDVHLWRGDFSVAHVPSAQDLARLDVDERARRHFGKREFDRVRAAGPANAAPVFFDCWTRKEAFIKATGEGLSRALDLAPVSMRARFIDQFRYTPPFTCRVWPVM